ncbi:hypothetical protein G7Z17_g2574 [Cylindrodendrum hubeiense]|uniref:Uncharacterized protein n=1 Tax=Cylindrodendrum hubeiense TaxID=595255 RepID=A0A9P5HJJ9_9HYPO|nr:hypothetical protein G7Z17_g2574 [Cylindrodendrum hubeiense]
MAHVRLINPPSLFDPTEHLYSHVSVVENPSRLIHVAGQIAVDKDGNTPEDTVAQAKLALSNLRACLEAAGASVRDICNLTVYSTDTDAPIWGEIGKFLTDDDGSHLPPAAVIPVPKLGAPQ